MIVFVGREDCVNPGKLFSEVRNKTPILGKSVTIDRESRRGPITGDALIARAKSLAELLGIEYIEDFTWHCVAMKKMPCGCPRCTTSRYS